MFLNNYNINDVTLKHIIEHTLEEVKSGGKNGYAYYQNLISLLATHYINNYSNFRDLRDNSFVTSKITREKMVLIDQYINENMDKNISVDDLAERLNYSKYYFLREFKKLNGITPYQNVVEKKIQIAKNIFVKTRLFDR